MQKKMSGRQTRHEESEDRNICTSAFNDFDPQNGKFEDCFSNSEMVRSWSFPGLGEENMVWNAKLLQMSWSPISKTAVIKSSNLPMRWIVGSGKKGGRCTIHFSVQLSNEELLFSSANQLSIHGAVNVQDAVNRYTFHTAH